jgi:hypothetical protein
MPRRLGQTPGQRGISSVLTATVIARAPLGVGTLCDSADRTAIGVLACFMDHAGKALYSSGMNETTKPYMAFLCCMDEAGELLSQEPIYLAANDDQEALRESTRWARRLENLTEGETWLVIKQGDRTVHAEKLRGAFDRRGTSQRK